MKVGIIGGTGGMGKGFAVRWCKDHNVLIGSRDAERASASAQEYLELVKEYFNYSNEKAKESIRVLTEDQLEAYASSR